MRTTRPRSEPSGDDTDCDRLRDPFGSSHPQLDAAWRRYCDVVRELEMTAAELEALRK